MARVQEVHPVGEQNPNESQSTHPWVLYALGHRLWFLTVKYPAGFANGRQTADRILAQGKQSNPKGTSLYDLFGEYDLLARIWTGPNDLKAMVDALHNEGIEDVRVFPINWIYSPIQQKVDSELQEPFTLGRALVRRGNAWEVNRAFFDPMHRDSIAGKFRFFVFFKCAREDEAEMFERVRDNCDHALRVLERTDTSSFFENYAIYSYSTGTEAGCILTGVTENWQAMQPAFFRLLQSAGVADRKTTTLIQAGQNDIEDERPDPKSLKREDIHDVPGLRLQVIEMSLGLAEITKGTALADRFRMMFLRDDVAESIALYDPLYWWRFLHELRYLFENLAQHRNGRVLAFFMLAYTRIEAELRRLALSHFRLPEEREQEFKSKFERLVLDKCGVLKMEAPRRNANKLVRRLHEEKPNDPYVRSTYEAAKTSLGDCAKAMEDQLKTDSYIMLGRVARIIRKTHEFGGIAEQNWELFDSRRMKNWEDLLKTIADDRNSLMHGTILDVYQAPREGAAPWEELASNYIRAYPRVQWIIDALRKNLADLSHDQKVLVGATETGV